MNHDRLLRALTPPRDEPLTFWGTATVTAVPGSGAGVTVQDATGTSLTGLSCLFSAPSVSDIVLLVMHGDQLLILGPILTP